MSRRYPAGLRGTAGRGRRIAPRAPAFSLRIAKTGDRPGPIVQNGLRSVRLLPIRGASKRTGKPDRKAGAQSHGTDSGPPGYRKERGYPMKGKTKKIVLAVAVIGAIAAGGVAFTATNSVPVTSAGFGTAAVSGAAATNIHHNLSDDGLTILTTDLTLSGNQTANTVKAGFGPDGTHLDLAAASSTCVPGTYDAIGATTDLVCTYATPVTTTTALAF